MAVVGQQDQFTGKNRFFSFIKGQMFENRPRVCENSKFKSLNGKALHNDSDNTHFEILTSHITLLFKL